MSEIEKMSLDKLKTLTARELRSFTTKNAIIKGINRFTKKDYLREIPISKWWSLNIIDKSIDTLKLETPIDKSIDSLKLETPIDKSIDTINLETPIDSLKLKSKDFKVKKTIKESEIMELKKKLLECELKITKLSSKTLF
jgi:hypothetical protein